MPGLIVTVVQPPRSVKITNTEFMPTEVNPTQRATLKVTLDMQQMGDLVFRVYICRESGTGCGPQATPQGCSPTAQDGSVRNVIGQISGTTQLEFFVTAPDTCSSTSQVTYMARIDGVPPERILPPNPGKDQATLTIQPGQVVRYIKPPVISLAVTNTKQLTPESQDCQPMQQFPQGTTFATSNTGVATVNATGLITARSTGVADVQARLPGSNTDLRTAAQGCVMGQPPRVQVGPMTIRLRFLNDAVLYLRDAANGGLGLGQMVVDQIQTRTRDRVQELFDQAMANVRVELAQGPVTVANDDAVMVVDITAIRDAGGRFQRAPDQVPNLNTQQTYTLGQAQINHLNLNFGGDILYDANAPQRDRLGVFVNQFPYYRNRLLVVNDAMRIGNGIGNVAAHEAGHRLGLVPNPASRPNPTTQNSSEQERDRIRDDRFAGWIFDGTVLNHTREFPDHNPDELMTSVTLGGNLLGDPYIFTTTPRFRRDPRQDAEYLRIILPRP
jgi:hypothetical protein